MLIIYILFTFLYIALPQRVVPSWLTMANQTKGVKMEGVKERKLKYSSNAYGFWYALGNSQKYRLLHTYEEATKEFKPEVLDYAIQNAGLVVTVLE